MNSNSTVGIVAGQGETGCGFPDISRKLGAIVASRELQVAGLYNPGSFPFMEGYLEASAGTLPVPDWRQARLYVAGHHRDIPGEWPVPPRGATVHFGYTYAAHVEQLVRNCGLIVVGPVARVSTLTTLLATTTPDTWVAVLRQSVGWYTTLVEHYAAGVGLNQIVSYDDHIDFGVLFDRWLQQQSNPTS